MSRPVAPGPHEGPDDGGPHGRGPHDEGSHGGADAGHDDPDALHEAGRRRDTLMARRYGASAWHLVTMLGLAAVTAYAVSRLLGDPALIRIAAWFVGAAVVWDLLLGPLYAGADAALRPVSRRLRVQGVRPLNYVRVPALLSSLLLVVYAPLVLQRSEGVFSAKSGLSQDVYLGRWLGVTAALFGVSAVLYLVAVLRARR